MNSRLELQEILAQVFVRIGRWLWDPFEFSENTVEEAIAKYASQHVYFQPPETVKMSFPCIVYTLDDINSRYADNQRYSGKRAYTVTVIDKNPDSEIPDFILDLPYTSFSRHYTSNNLHHFSFRLYY